MPEGRNEAVTAQSHSHDVGQPNWRRVAWLACALNGHANSYRAFSAVDDASEKELFPSVSGWVDIDVPHGSVALVEDGHLFGRVLSAEGVFSPMERIMVVGDDV